VWALDISIILPTRNETDGIAKCINKISDTLEKQNLTYELLIMDDESTDGTKDVVAKLSGSNKNIRLVNRSPPYGFGYSIRDGIQMANGKMAAIMMADLSDNPAFLASMKERIDTGCDCVNGSRFLKGSKITGYSTVKYISNRMFNIAVMAGFFTGVTDTSNNFKAFRTDKAKKVTLDSRGFEVGAELMLKMLINGMNICEVPVTWEDRASGTAKFRLRNNFIKYFLLFLKMLKYSYFDRFFR
jgi:dolichol-phosphate mannosyltransferase